MTMLEPTTRAEMQAAHRARIARMNAAAHALARKNGLASRMIYDAPIGPQNTAIILAIHSALPSILTLQERVAPTITRDQVADAVSRVCLFPRIHLFTHRRWRKVTTARQIYYYLSRIHTGASLPSIGRLANRDHSTVLNGIERIKRLIKAGDESIIATVSEVEALLLSKRTSPAVDGGA